MMVPNVAVFVQYRYTNFEAQVDIDPVDLELDLATHHAAAGVGFHF